jgi:RES domain-containing protein
LAVLEVRVHLDIAFDLLPDDYALLRVTLPDESEDAAVASWHEVVRVGDAWLDAARTPVLCVPSAVVPRARNLLLNPRHPAGAQAQVMERVPFTFDVRLWAVGA